MPGELIFIAPTLSIPGLIFLIAWLNKSRDKAGLTRLTLAWLAFVLVVIGGISVFLLIVMHDMARV